MKLEELLNLFTITSMVSVFDVDKDCIVANDEALSLLLHATVSLKKKIVMSIDHRKDCIYLHVGN